MTMPFGKYRGWTIEDLPDDYLAWLLSIDLRSPQLGWTVLSEWTRRRHLVTDLPADKRTIVLSCEELPLAVRLVDAGRKSLAKQCHPDHGGDPHEMAAVNVLADSLKEQIALLLEDAR